MDLILKSTEGTWVLLCVILLKTVKKNVINKNIQAGCCRPQAEWTATLRVPRNHKDSFPADRKWCYSQVKLLYQMHFNLTTKSFSMGGWQLVIRVIGVKEEDKSIWIFNTGCESVQTQSRQSSYQRCRFVVGAAGSFGVWHMHQWGSAGQVGQFRHLSVRSRS